MNLGHTAHRNSVIIFFALTYTMSWLIWIPMATTAQNSQPLFLLATFAPTLSSIALTALVGGRAGLRELLRRLFIWRIGIIWYAISVLGPFVVVLAALGLHVALGGAIPRIVDPAHVIRNAAQGYLVIIVFAYVLVFSVLGEEMGWRGFALPRLQARFSALGASLVLGMMWCFWHAPLFWIAGNFHQQLPFVWFALQIIASTILYTWLYNNTRGSLLIAHLFHAASNTAVGVLPILPLDNGGDLRPLWLMVGVLWIIALIVVVIFGPARLSRMRVEV